MQDRWDPRRWSLAGRQAVLAFAVLTMAGVVSPWAWSVGATHGLVALAVAAACCWIGAASAMVVSGGSSGGARAVTVVLIAMFFRMAAPLGLAIVVRFRRPHLVDAGIFYYLLLFYPLTLALETWMSLRRRESPAQSSRSPEKLPS